MNLSRLLMDTEDLLTTITMLVQIRLGGTTKTAHSAGRTARSVSQTRQNFSGASFALAKTAHALYARELLPGRMANRPLQSTSQP